MYRLLLLLGLSGGWVSMLTSLLLAQGSDPYAAARARLVDTVLKGGGITNQRVLSAMNSTLRHEFVPPEFRKQSYYDKAIPIGESQTISSPYIVAVMTQELDPQPTDKVLEIGTGSGYQAAVLSPLVKDVYSIEIVPELGEKAAKVLKKLNYTNVHTKVGDGYKGWEEHAPFNKIIVTCSPENVPQPLIDQLVDDGLIIIPVGERYQQTLMRMRKKGNTLEKEALRPTLFVPMTGTAEDQRKVQADPTNPKLINGDFEEQPLKSGDVPGWYYQRGMAWNADKRSPSGGHHVTFNNEEAGTPTTLLQGFAVDGTVVRKLRIEAFVRTQNVTMGQANDEWPAITVQFFDEKRERLAMNWIGPFRGTSGWTEKDKEFEVPIGTKEAILSIGLFGAVGRVSFDNIRITGIK